MNIPQASGSSDLNRSFNVSVIDGKNQYVNAGISYTRRTDVDFVHLALAKRATSWLSFGASGKRFSTRSNSALTSMSNGSTSGFEGGVSATTLIPSPITEKPIQVGITADNLMHRRDQERFVGPRQVGVGVKLNFRDMLMLYGDAVENFSHFSGTRPSYSGGAEIALGGDFYARGGMFTGLQKGWSAGGGWVGPKLGVSYGYQNKREDAARSFQHAVSMDVFM